MPDSQKPEDFKVPSDADLIINVAKLKTHRFMAYTGAVKNMFVPLLA